MAFIRLRFSSKQATKLSRHTAYRPGLYHTSIVNMSSAVRQRELAENDKNVSKDKSSVNRDEGCNTLKDLKPKFIYNGILVAILVFYGLAGAAVFRKLEMVTMESESVDIQNPALTKENLIQELWTSNHKQLEFSQWSALATEKLELYEKTLHSSQQASTVTTQWSWSNSWLFACTILTTVGYGNIAPESLVGRCFCLLYALAGIPLFNVVLCSIGGLLTEIVTCIRVMRRRRQADKLAKKDDDFSPSDGAEDGSVTIKQLAVSSVVYLAFGAVLFRVSEEWSLIESFYYCFITLSTIGLGDYVPENIHHTAIFGVYLLLGLVLITMMFSAMESEIVSRLRALRQKVGIKED